MPPTGPQLVHAIKRNFGGLREENLDPQEIFWELLPRDIVEPPDLTNIPHHVSSALVTLGVHAQEGYSTCLVCVCLSVTTLSATSVVSTLKNEVCRGLSYAFLGL